MLAVCISLLLLLAVIRMMRMITVTSSASVVVVFEDVSFGSEVVLQARRLVESARHG